MRYLTIRCDGPGCTREVSRLFAALPASVRVPTGPDAYALPGRWHTLSYQGLEDQHFCGYGCLMRWAQAQQLPAGTVDTLADVLPDASVVVVAAADGTDGSAPDIAERATAAWPVMNSADAVVAG